MFRALDRCYQYTPPSVVRVTGVEVCNHLAHCKKINSGHLHNLNNSLPLAARTRSVHERVVATGSVPLSRAKKWGKAILLQSIVVILLCIPLCLAQFLSAADM
jgi:ABC-type maltose transport system permease subunit